MKRWLALIIISYTICAESDPAKVSHALVEIYANYVLRTYEGVDLKIGSGLGVVVHRNEKLIATFMVNLHDSFYPCLHIKFSNGLVVKGTVIYKDPVLGFAFIRVPELPNQARAIPFVQSDELSSGWFYTTIMDFASSWCANPVSLIFSPRLRLRSFRFLKVVEESLYGGAIFSKDGSLIGLKGNGSIMDALYVPASFIRDALNEVLRDSSYRPYYLDVQTQTISFTQALQGNFFSDDLCALIRDMNVSVLEMVMISNIDALKVGDIILKVDEQPVTHYLSLVHATRRRPNVSLEVVRDGKRQHIHLALQQFSCDCEGVLCCNEITYFYMNPFLVFKYPNYRVGSLLCRRDAYNAYLAHLYGRRGHYVYRARVDAVKNAPASMRDLADMLDRGVLLTIERRPQSAERLFFSNRGAV